MRIKNFYTATSAEPGDVFLVTIKAVVQYDGTYRLYRCPAEVDRVPDGDRLYDGDRDEEPFGPGIFPILRATKGPDLS